MADLVISCRVLDRMDHFFHVGICPPKWKAMVKYLHRPLDIHKMGNCISRGWLTPFLTWLNFLSQCPLLTYLHKIESPFSIVQKWVAESVLPAAESIGRPAALHAALHQTLLSTSGGPAVLGCLGWDMLLIVILTGIRHSWTIKKRVLSNRIMFSTLASFKVKQTQKR